MLTQPPSHPEAFACNRVDDRRRNNARAAFYTLFMKRRAQVRRDSETGIYVDVHERKLFYFAFGAILLCAADAFFTMNLINFHGSWEMNPVMDYFLQKDITLFFYVKFCLTSLGIVFLLMHKNFTLFNLFTGKQLLLLSFYMYAILVSYELYMLVIVPTMSALF